MPQITDSKHRNSAQIRDSNRQQQIASCFMIWHTGRELYRHLLKVLSLLCYPVNASNVFCYSVTHHHITDILVYTITHNTYTIYYTMRYILYTLYIPYLHTLLYTMLYHTVQYIYILIRSDTTPSHDLLLLHKDIHIISVYASPSAMSYIIIYHTYNRIQKQDRQHTADRHITEEHKKKRYISTASVLFTKYKIDCFLCLTACRYDKLVIIFQGF